MSEAEFLAWATKNDARAEWVEGEVIVMAPANFEHQDLIGWLYKLLSLYVERRDLGFVVQDVWTRLYEPRNQLRAPDVLFLSKERIGPAPKGQVQIPPDLIIEVVSSDSEARDWREKYIDYRGAGVREYWVVDFMSETIEAYTLEGNEYRKLEELDGRINSIIIPGWYIRTQWLWQQPRPIVLDVLPELGIK